jgi:hypothetical protein
MYVIVARPTRKRRKGVLLSHGACHNSLGVEHSLSKRKVVGSNPACGFQATIFLSFLFGPLKREFPWCVLARMACGRLGIVTSLHTHYPRSVFGWCSWLSRQSNTLKVPSSILGSNNFRPPHGHTLSSILVKAEECAMRRQLGKAVGLIRGSFG